MKATCTFVSTILTFISTFGIAVATSSEPTKAAFDINRELRRGPRDCDSFLERYAKRDTGAEEAFAEVLEVLSDNVVADKMLKKMNRKADVAACINEVCNNDPESFTPGVCLPDDDEDRRGLRRRGDFGGGRRGGPDELCENIEDAEEVISALTEKFGDPFEEQTVTNKPARRAIMMLTMGTMMCGDF